MREKVFLSPSKYIQGKGVLDECAPEYIVKDLGRKILMIAGNHAYEAAGKKTGREAGGMRSAGEV